jgi:hypothetical protein
MLLLFSVLACCSYSQFLHTALILNSCMLLLFSIPAALVRQLFYSILLNFCSSCYKFCCSCFVNPDVIFFKNPAALILWKNLAALVTNATCPLLKFCALILNSCCSYSALLFSISVLLFLTSWLWPRVWARALREPLFLGSLKYKTGRCAYPTPPISVSLILSAIITIYRENPAKNPS